MKSPEGVTFSYGAGLRGGYAAYWIADEYGLKYVVAPRRGAGRRPGCLSCVTVDATTQEDGSWEVWLESLGRFPGCSDPEMDDGMSAELAKAAVGRVLQRIGTRQVVRLTDNSDFPCGCGAGAPALKVDLTVHNALVYGATYYQRKLGAEPSQPGTAALLRAIRGHRSSPAPSTPEALLSLVRERGEMRGRAAKELGAALEALRGAWPRTWGELYASLNGLRPCGCAWVARLGPLAMELSGLPRTTTLRGSVWVVPERSAWAWRSLVVEVRPLQEGEWARRVVNFVQRAERRAVSRLLAATGV